MNNEPARRLSVAASTSHDTKEATTEMSHTKDLDIATAVGETSSEELSLDDIDPSKLPEALEVLPEGHSFSNLAAALNTYGTHPNSKTVTQNMAILFVLWLNLYGSERREGKCRFGTGNILYLARLPWSNSQAAEWMDLDAAWQFRMDTEYYPHHWQSAYVPTLSVFIRPFTPGPSSGSLEWVLPISEVEARKGVLVLVSRAGGEEEGEGPGEWEVRMLDLNAECFKWAVERLEPGTPARLSGGRMGMRVRLVAEGSGPEGLGNGGVVIKLKEGADEGPKELFDALLARARDEELCLSWGTVFDAICPL